MDNEISKSVRRGIRLAAKAALNGDSPSYHIGAVIVKSGKVIATGWNCYRKTSPDADTRYRTIHAEFSCINNLTIEQLTGACMFIARVTNGGSLNMSKPCYACEALLKKLPLKRIYYTGRDGRIEIFN